MKKGVLYVATGKKHLKEAVFSAASVIKVSPATPIALVTDQHINSSLFDQVITLDNPDYSFRDKITGMKMTPYDHTLFLDTDTYVCRDINDLFIILERFDFAAAHDVKRRSVGLEDLMEAPACFPEFNSGVILYRQSQDADVFLANWKEIYDEYFFIEKDRNQTHKGDQPAFREALFRSALQVYVLPPEYNLRLFGPFFLQQEAVILHGRLRYPADYQRVEKQLSKVDKLPTEFARMRVYLPGIGTFANGGRLIKLGKKINWLHRLLHRFSVKTYA